MLLFLLFCLPFFCGCKKPNANSENGIASEVKTPATEMPAWLRAKTTEFEKAKPANPPVKIYSYRYHNQLVYLITGRCCDIPSEVYTTDGKQLCQPDGGITGRGDGRCADFSETKTEEKLIWEDLRTQ